MAQGRRPEGTITRGTTAPNRLRRVDRWIARVHGPLLRRHDRPLVVDLGYGASPVTTAELFTRLRAVHPRVEVVGIEIDPLRVAAARPYEREGLSFHLGGFELPVGRPPVLIRAFNVLRQYEETEAWRAWDRLCAGLAPDGVLVEGTCGEIGRRAVWVALGRKRAPYGGTGGRGGEVVPGTANAALGGSVAARGGTVAARDETGAWSWMPPRGVADAAGGDGPDVGSSAGPRGVVPRPRGSTGPHARRVTAVAVPHTITFAAHLPTLPRPSELAERLPKTLIHRNVPGEPVHELLSAFDRAWAAAAPQSVFGPRQRWIAAVELLARDHPVHTGPPLGGRARWRLGELTLAWSAVDPRPDPSGTDRGQRSGF